MDRTKAIVRLLRHKAELKGLGAKRLFLFGSTAREEAGPNSDVDLFSITSGVRSGYAS